MSVANSLLRLKVNENAEHIEDNADEIALIQLQVNENTENILNKTFNVAFQELENYTNQIPTNTDEILTLQFTNIINPLIDVNNGIFTIKVNANYLFTLNGQLQRTGSNGGISFINYRLNSSIGQIGSTQCVELSDSSTTIPISKTFLLPVKNAPLTIWFEAARNDASTGNGRTDGGFITIPSTTSGFSNTPSLGISCVYMP